MKFRKISAFLVVTMAIVSLAGCGKAPASGETGSQPASAPASSASTQQKESSGQASASGEKVTLSISAWDNTASPQLTAITEAFVAEYPNVEIEIIDTQADEYDNKLTVMLSGGGSDPDVILVKNAETQVTMKNKGQILSLEDYIERDGFDLSIYSGAAEKLKMDDTQYTLPFRKDWYVLYYNKKIFDDAGVPYPSDDMTWNEYEELAKKMTKGEGSAKIYGSHNHTWMGMVSNWAVQDGKNTLMSEDYTFLKPYYEQALRLQDEGIVQSYANLKTASIHYISAFEQGNIAMLPMGCWFIGTLINDKQQNNFDFDWGVTRIPHPDEVPAGSVVGAVTPIAINAKSDVPDVAWDFLKFAAGEKGAEILAKYGGFPAAESDAVTEALSNMEGFPADGKAALTTTGFVFDRPLDSKMASVRKVIEEEHDLIMIGEEDIDTGIENMNKRAKEARED